MAEEFTFNSKVSNNRSATWERKSGEIYGMAVIKQRRKGVAEENMLGRPLRAKSAAGAKNRIKPVE